DEEEVAAQLARKRLVEAGCRHEPQFGSFIRRRKPQRSDREVGTLRDPDDDAQQQRSHRQQSQRVCDEVDELGVLEHVSYLIPVVGYALCTLRSKGWLCKARHSSSPRRARSWAPVNGRSSRATYSFPAARAALLRPA